MKLSMDGNAIRLVWLAVLLLAIVAMVMAASNVLIFGVSVPGDTAAEMYTHHIALIVQNKDALLWDEVYTAAREVGKKYGVLLERIGEHLATPIDEQRAMDMAIYAKVDGILLQSEDSDEMRALIRKAKEKGIPVVTLLRDIPDSERHAFVGVNDYFLGQAYGKRLLKIVDGTARNVVVLASDNNSDERGRSWFLSGLQNAVAGHDYEIQMVLCQSIEELNNTDTIVQGLLSKGDSVPDVLICLEASVTSSAYRVLADRNLARRIRIIGSDQSEDVLSAIKAGHIDSSIVVDAASLGRLGTEAMVTYLRYHLVSYFTEVNTELIDQAALMEKQVAEK